MAKTPENVDVKSFKEAVCSIAGVGGVHHLHIWSLDGEKTIATMHVEIEKGATLSQFEEIKKQVQEVGKSYEISHLTVQIDTQKACCQSDCDL